MALRKDLIEIGIEIEIATADVTGTRKDPAAAPGLGLGQGQGQGLQTENVIDGIGIETAGRIGRRTGDRGTPKGAGEGEPNRMLNIRCFFLVS